MSNEVLNCILTRRSIRKYKPAPVEREKLDAILEAATWAPSGSNNQTCLFTVITSEADLNELNGVIKTGFDQWVPDSNYPAKLAAREHSRTENYNFRYGAPVLIIASNLESYQNAMADCAAALQNVFLAAHSLGLGTCWLNQLRWLTDEKIVREYLLEKFSIPLDHFICGSSALGYADHTPAPPKRKEGNIRIF